MVSGNKTLAKTIWREIRDSLSRYLAIVGIIALGSGFFTGLKVTNTAMIETCERYVRETAFYDFQLLSTMGWDSENLAALAAAEGVESAEGAISTDFLADIAGRELVLKAHSLTPAVNRTQLVSGRMPERPGECLADSYSLSAMAVGTVIRVAADNDEETREMFAAEEYTVVGTVRSPLYMNFERGTTTLGNGTVAGFLYLLPEGFDADYYTEIYLTLREKGYVYSEAYDALTEAAEGPLESMVEEQGRARYERVKRDAEEELADARAEYDDALAEYDDGVREYEDGLREYEDGAAELEKSRQELEDGVFYNLNNLDNTQRQLDSRQAELEASLAEYSAQLSQAQAGLARLQQQYDAADEATRAYLAPMLSELQGNVAALQGAVAQVNDGLAQIASARSEIEAGRIKLYNVYYAGLVQLEEAEEELQEAREELDEAEEELREAKEELDDAERELSDAREELDELSPPDTYLLGRDANTGYACFESDAGIVDGIATVFPFFFFAVAALVCVTTMNRMVDDERGQLGILKALGYGEGAVMSRYLIYSGSASLLGCLVGVIAGSYVFPTVIWQAYRIMYNLPAITLVFDVRLMLLAGGSYLALAMLVTYLTCRRELSEPAASLIRPKSPPAGKRIWLEYIGFFWRRLPFLHKVSLRNVFRYRKRLVMMVLGIGGCTALLLTGLGLNDSITHVADRQFQEITVYDATVNFSRDMTGREERFLTQCGESVTDSAFLYGVSARCGEREAAGAVNLCAAEDFARLEGLVDFHYAGQPVAAPADGTCLISQGLAERGGFAVGDTITLVVDDTERLTMTVSGIFENVIYNYVYTTLATARAALPETPLKLAYLNFPEDADVHEAGAVVAAADDVMNIQLCADMLSRVNSMLDSMKYVVLLVIVCAGALAFIVLFNLTNINIQERIREIATIKVLGFFAGETGQYVFRENLILTLCGCLAGLPMGVWLHNFVMSQIRIEMISFVVERTPMSYGLSVALTFVFAFAVNLFMTPRLERINMAEALKSVE